MSQHRIAAEFLDHEHAGRARLVQDVFEFVGAKAGIDGDQDDAGHRRAELDHDPFGNVVRPDRHPLARLETAAQGTRRALRLNVELRIGPLAPIGRIRNAGDQRDPVGRGPCGLFEQLAERDVAHGREPSVRRRKIPSSSLAASPHAGFPVSGAVADSSNYDISAAVIAAVA